MSRLTSRLRTRRVSRIGLRASSIALAFSRTSPAWLDGVEYPANTARYPSVNGIKGLLNEEGTTNIIRHSDDWTQASVWIPQNSGTGAAPVLTYLPTGGPGGGGATRLQLNAGTGLTTADYALVQQNVTGLTNPHTASQSLKIRTNDGTTKKIFIRNPASTARTAITVTPAWQTVKLESLVSNSTANLLQIGACVGYGSDASVDVLVCNAQTELKPFATSEVVTGAATVTRAAETTTVSTVGLLTPSQGSVIIETYVNGNNAVATPAAQRTLFGMEGAGGDRIELRRTTGGVFQAITGNSTGSTATTWTNAPAEGLHRYCLAFDVVELVLAADGADRNSAASPKIPGDLQPLMYVNSNWQGVQQWGSPTTRMWFYDRKLSPAERTAATLGNPPPDFTANIRFDRGQMEVIQGHPWRMAELLNLLLDAPTVGPK